MPTALLLNQSAELYGSDRMFLATIKSFQRNHIRPIVVVPQRGPLVELLRADGVAVCITSIGKISSRDTGIRRGLLFCSKMLYSQLMLDLLIYRFQPTLIYTNSLAVLGGFFAAHRHGIAHIYHVHEIVERPAMAAKLYWTFLRWNQGHIIFNSRTTSEYWYSLGSLCPKHTATIRNPISEEFLKPPDSMKTSRQLRARLGVRSSSLLIVIVGRLSPRKGQMRLLDALAQIYAEMVAHDVHVLMIGDPAPGFPTYGKKLTEHAKALNLSNHFHRQPFMRNIRPAYYAADIVVVPSEEPESFGLVALEAMACGRPVIASRAGALEEVLGAESEMLFEPGNSEALARVVGMLVRNKQQRTDIGTSNRRRALQWPKAHEYMHDIQRIVEQVTAVGPENGRNDQKL